MITVSDTKNRQERPTFSDIRERLEEERDEALDHLETPDIENPEAAYWGGRYYITINMLLWLSDYSRPVFEKSERFDSNEQ